MANKFYVSELFPDQHYNAAVGRKDIELLLESWSFVKLDFKEFKAGIRFKINAYLKLIEFVRKVQRNDVVFFHLPLYSRVKKMLLLVLRWKGVNCVACVNDLEGLRDQNPSLLTLELKTLSHFSGAIVLNERMQEFVADRCPELTSTALTIWDYLAEKIPEFKQRQMLSIAFAGNQQKASFICQLGEIENVCFHLYGSSFFSQYPENCVVHGEVDSKHIVTVMEGSFGLVWDGSSIDGCDGNNGQYLKINSPYKLSLYLLAGMPVIIWKEAALAKWITSNGYGIAVTNLRSIENVLKAISEEEYRKMQKAIETIRPQIATGQFLKKALRPLLDRV